MKDLTNGKTFKVLLRFAIPLIIAGLMTQSYNLVDLIVAGRFIGEDALSATGAATTVIQFLSSLFWGFGIAISTVVGKYYGEKNNKGIVRSFKTCMIFISIAMLFLCGLCVLFSSQIMDALKVDPTIYEEARIYFVIYIISLFFQALLYQITSSLQCLGDSKFPMIITLASGLANVGLNVLFVVPLNMGTAGLAYATLISAIVGVFVGMIRILQYIKELGEDYKPVFDFEEFRYVGKLAIPCILQQCALYFSSVLIQPLINVMGKDFTGAYSLAMNVNLIFNAIYHSISRSVAAYSSQSLGSQKYENFDKGIKNGFLLQIILNLPLLIFTLIYPSAIFKIFLTNQKTEILPQAILFAYTCLPFVYVCAYGNLMHSFFKSVKSTNTVLISTFVFTVARVIFAYTIRSSTSLVYIYLSLSFGWCVESILLLLLYKFKYRKKLLNGIIGN